MYVRIHIVDLYERVIFIAMNIDTKVLHVSLQGLIFSVLAILNLFTRSSLSLVIPAVFLLALLCSHIAYYTLWKWQC